MSSHCPLAIGTAAAVAAIEETDPLDLALAEQAAEEFQARVRLAASQGGPATG